ncbi:unnamed protein product [Blepharisma stoltei]|uniref:Uncharacterized protein n=1 Tax=Blepharisma stoltei TaxID=1481888 RepID=A0AAU9JNB4_9CILI|nr:unnamed protein product [Blepharisma stoltei]
MIGLSIPAARANKKYMCQVYLFSVLALFAGLVAFFVMAGTAMITFEDSCNEISGHLSSQASSCALTGPNFDLFNLLFVFILSISFWIYVYALQKEEEKISQAQNGGILMAYFWTED